MGLSIRDDLLGAPARVGMHIWSHQAANTFLMLQAVNPIGQMRFEAKEHADKCLATMDPETGLCTFPLGDDEGTANKGALKLKVEAISGDEEAAAWKAWQTDVAARNLRDAGRGERRPRSSGGGRGGRGAKRGRS